ncbi:hypothetical protein BGZ98_007633 [Dissophora globulifera]|nr:hypothetical protein BGZ98_007633 [Dissophora globulifera]
MRAKRTRRDLQDYPIFTTGNPPDIVRLAIEFGHVPFIDHLLHRGFRPRELPEHFSLVPFLSVERSDVQRRVQISSSDDEQGRLHTTDREGVAELEEQTGHCINGSTSISKRFSELNQIWECMRVANQELIDACSRADFDAVLKVLDATLSQQRLVLEASSDIGASSALGSDSDSDSPLTQKCKTNKGKQRHPSYDAPQDRHDSIGTGSVAHFLRGDIAEFNGAGVGSFSSSQPGSSASHSRDRTANAEEGEQLRELEQITVIPVANFTENVSAMPVKSSESLVSRSALFKTKRRAESCSGDDLTQTASRSSSYVHMPWIDGRALTSALLAVCFRRDGYESEESEALEERRAVPIVTEILKYDCMLTAQSLGQAVLGIAYSRSSGSLKRAYDQRFKRFQRHEKDSSPVGLPEAVSQSSTSTSTRVPENDSRGPDVSVMDLLMERIGPREWLKLIKCYLQRQEFEDLAVILELCPFKGPQLETKYKDIESRHRYSSRTASKNITVPHELYRQQARELICREAGICSVGSRLNHFNGRGIGQASYNVSATLHDTSRVVFTGSGARFNHNFMLPRGGFRGIGGNTSGHTSSAGTSSSTDGIEAGELFTVAAEATRQSTPATEGGHSLDQPQSSRHSQHERRWQPLMSNSKSRGEEELEGEEEEEVVTDGDGDGDGDLSNSEQLDVQDSSLAFGGVGSSTTSSSRPGPGIVGIAIQVQAPEHIVNALLRMGFRFFCICDLSISDTRHPLALRFRQQEIMNRQLIEFSMVPNTDIISSTLSGTSLGPVEVKGKAKARRTDARDDKTQYDLSDMEHHAQIVERFLYPAASHLARPSASSPTLPSQVPGINGSDGSDIQQQSDASTESDILEFASPLSVSESVPAQASSSSALSASDRLHFELPPMYLGESFDSIASVVEFPDHSSVQESALTQEKNPDASYPAPISQAQYQNSGLAKSMPLPIRKSMTESRDTSSGCSSIPRTPDLSIDHARATALLAHQRMVNETTKRRIREQLSSEYIDLVTVGICLYQACYHMKEHLLKVLLEHRLLIAQDALSGAVQVAASVGWRRGLVILLMEHGDMEAEIDPVVTTTSEYVHQGTSMKWDHASAIPIDPGETRAGIRQGNQSNPAAIHEGFVIHSDLRRHRSDGSRLNQLSNSSSRGGDIITDIGSMGAGVRTAARSTGLTRSVSLGLSHSPRIPIPSILSPPSLAPVMPFSGAIVPNARSSSLQNRLSPEPTASAEPDARIHGRMKENKKKQQRQKDKALRHELGTTKPSHVSNSDHGDDVNGTSRTQRHPQPATVLLLSTSSLWSLPNVMIQRKNRNAVVALMAAVTRNDPDLVSWLVESFADIKIAHVMQALMIACNRGLIRVVQALVGKRSDSKIEEDRPRHLLRQWLAFQTQMIMEKTGSGSGSVPGLETLQGNFQQRLDSYPFVFLMESSPVFRHYYQILNTLSSCQFMTRKRNSHPASPLAATSAAFIPANVNAPNLVSGTSASRPTSSFMRVHRRSQQQQQSLEQTPISGPTSAAPLLQPPPAVRRSRTRPRTPQETKIEIIRILLDPLLEIFGSISFRRALDRMPRDCWWPLDHDVRLLADQAARMAMVTIVTNTMIAKKRQQKKQRLSRRNQKQERSEHTIVATTDVLSEKSLEIQEDEKQRASKKRWHRLAGQRVQKWVVQANRTNSKAEYPSIPSECDEKHAAAHVENISSMSFFKRLSFANTSV